MKLVISICTIIIPSGCISITDFYWLVFDGVDAAIADIIIINNIFVFSSTDLNTARTHNVFLRSTPTRSSVWMWMSEWNFDCTARGLCCTSCSVCVFSYGLSLNDVYLYFPLFHLLFIIFMFVAIFLPPNADVSFKKLHSKFYFGKNFHFCLSFVHFSMSNDKWIYVYMLLPLTSFKQCKLKSLLLDA